MTKSKVKNLFVVVMVILSIYFLVHHSAELFKSILGFSNIAAFLWALLEISIFLLIVFSVNYYKQENKEGHHG